MDTARGYFYCKDRSGHSQSFLGMVMNFKFPLRNLAKMVMEFAVFCDNSLPVLHKAF
jgi:hypothetical protein